MGQGRSSFRSLFTDSPDNRKTRRKPRLTAEQANTTVPGRSIFSPSSEINVELKAPTTTGEYPKSHEYYLPKVKK